ncbi:Murein DD-endopeptidase MepM [Sporomusa ovata DSM 2662]|uniref:Membrane proteins related to metalloendopeptidases n=1 Tax=Sporomusa ovata TaxID=2378 RepID=A0A0U1KRQ1_9FIRM|nr:peptidase M23 [Sporomusa ovata DSM 2662]CQR70097.1 Membrane proteins related to metalloendopeptidases [Sporomusa ovata]
MHSPDETYSEQKVGSRWMRAISINWLIPLLCVLIIFGVGIVTNHHQITSASSIPTTEQETSKQEISKQGAIQYSGSGQAQDMESITKKVAKLAITPSIWPASGDVTSGFGWRSSPWGGGNELHPGIDIANSIGTPIFATADGVVEQSGWSGGYGNTVQIDHGNGIETIYGHNSSVLVNAGQSVKKGQIISYMGSTGRSTGPHVHYEVRVNGTAVDPIRFLVL